MGEPMIIQLEIRKEELEMLGIKIKDEQLAIVHDSFIEVIKSISNNQLEIKATIDFEIINEEQIIIEF